MQAYIDLIVATLPKVGNFMNGYVRRLEYWTVTIAFMIVNGIIGIVNEILSNFGTIGTVFTGVLAIVSFLMGICTLSLAIQKVRAHTGSGWKYAFFFIPIAGPFIILFWLIQPDDPTVMFD
jgi:uncharacterized membrane protein YhaH (DUF805 family)